MSSVRDRINATINRADDLLRVALTLAPREGRWSVKTPCADTAREHARADSWRCRQIAKPYDDSFRRFGVSTPNQ